MEVDMTRWLVLVMELCGHKRALHAVPLTVGYAPSSIFYISDSSSQ
jgi:hypothetical protein